MDAVKRLENGQMLAGFRIQELHRSGIAASVYRALSSHGGVVALKAVPEDADRRSILRLYQQAHRARMFDHPGLMPVERAAGAEGWHYVTAPWMAGGSLDQRLSSYGKLSTGVAVNVIVKVAKALDVLHAAGIVHGALQPDHIFFSEYDLPVLGGLAHSSEGTARDHFLREPDRRWSAPELIDPPERRIDPRSDVFGLARLLAAMLIGAPNSSDDTAEPMTVSRLQSDAIDCCPSLAEVIVQSLSTEVARRPRSAYQFARGVARAVSGDTAADELEWQPLADTSAAAEKWFVLMPSLQHDFHRMCRGTRSEVVRLLLRGRLRGHELAARMLSQPFDRLHCVPEFAAAAKYCAAAAN